VSTLRQTFPGVYFIDSGSNEHVATRNLTPGLRFYGEELLDIEGVEYRSWNPYRSKLAAAIRKGLNKLPLSPGNKVLYLGVASGTTCSHISDIVGEEGHIWGVDFAPRPIRDLIQNLVRKRGNVSPILGDARQPSSYSAMVPRVDLIYADVAQPDQAEIVVKNAGVFLKTGGWALMAVKSRSIDVVKPPKEIYACEVEKLRERGFSVVEQLELHPYEKDHSFVVAKFSH
jgi:fibrillarin-like pre-rRNA processing protein